MLSRRVRVIVPIFEALWEARRALDALWAHTRLPITLELIDDGSCPATAAALRAWAAAHPGATLIRQDANLGYLATANAALSRAREAGAELAVLVNSDVTVTPCWLLRLLRVFEDDPKVAAATPLSNSAGGHDLPIPPGWSAFQLAEALSEEGRTCPPFDLVTAAGFVLALRLSALPEPPFDPAYGRGYGEESDLSMRLREEGWRVVGVPWVFVHHCGAASFGARAKAAFLGSENFRTFMARWGERADAELARLRDEDPLAALRARFPAAPPQGWAGRLSLLRRMARSRGWRYTATEARRRGWGRLRDSLQSRGLWRTWREARTRLRPAARRAHGAVAHRPPPRKDVPRALLLLEEVNRSGGVQLALALVEALIARGWDARVAAPADSPRDPEALRRWGFRPWLWESEAELRERAPEVELVIATLWSTARWARLLLDLRRAGTGLMFAQDDEVRFYRDPRLQAQAREAPALLPHCLATSPWLAGVLAERGVQAEVLPGGVVTDDVVSRFLDEDDDAAPPARPAGPLRVLANARPERARRGFGVLVEALRPLVAEGRIALTLFGSERAAGAIPGAEVRGFVERSELRGLYASAEVYVDSSEWQAFGLPAFEAMAAGLAAIGPREGGWADYVEDGASALVVDTRDPAAIRAAVERLAEDAALRGELALRGQELACELDLRRFQERAASHCARLVAGRPEALGPLAPWRWA